jgi:hypothetical protein
LQRCSETSTESFQVNIEKTKKDYKEAK